MRKVDSKIEDVINLIKQRKGKEVDLEISRGRKKMQKLSGIIERVYPSIFTITEKEKNSSYSYSYADVLCGDVKLFFREESKEA